LLKNLFKAYGRLVRKGGRMDSRERILSALDVATPRLDNIPLRSGYVPMVPLVGEEKEGDILRFVDEARRLGCEIHRVEDGFQGMEVVLELIGRDRKIASWDLEKIPIKGLRKKLQDKSVLFAKPRDGNTRVGVSSVDAAIASTGSLVIKSGVGKSRAVSLLPEVHIAIVQRSQIYLTFEDWIAEVRRTGIEIFRKSSNVVVISGPSRTADIAMELVMGMHGPKELHIILLA
jgi:L-lactate dehydrogenase complex protein LldG